MYVGMNARTNAPVQEDERLLAEDDEDRVDQLEHLRYRSGAGWWALGINSTQSRGGDIMAFIYTL